MSCSQWLEMSGELLWGSTATRKLLGGFCFVEYYEKSAAQSAINYINGTKLDGRIVRTDWDVGFKEGRQYGRGRRGGQVGAL